MKRAGYAACVSADMAYVITEPCVATCDTACVEVCPVDAIHGPVPLATLRSTPLEALRARLPRLQLFIDPDACICCAACVPECPVNAIYDEDGLPREWAKYRELNAAFFAKAAP
jgi:NAD-dependent dihydropyrimidine dehydrogenase PreA subunit